jgi:tellurite methyltransferase
MLGAIRSRVRPGGVAAVNVLIEGTTYMDMFDAGGHCLFARDELATQFRDWDIVESGLRDFQAPGGRTKSFATVIARKP